MTYEPITDPVQIPLGKHGRPKTAGHYRSSHNDGRRYKRNKTGPKTYNPKAHTLVYDAGRGSGLMQRVESEEAA
jgi:hypothetical protein